ncbi:MAG: M1 family aminopeptidase [Hyphomicrobiales bacterium]
MNKNKAILFFLLIFYLIGCEKPKEVKNNISDYNISTQLDTTDLFLECRMQLNWMNSSDSLIYEIPFLFKQDSLDNLINRVEINDTNCSFKAISKETGGEFDGFVLQLNDPIKPFQEARIFIDFKGDKADWFRDDVMIYSNVFPVLQYFKDGVFNPHFQVHSNYKVKLSYPTQYKAALSGVINSTDTLNGIVENNAIANNVPNYGVVLLKDVELLEDSISGIKIRSFYFKDDAKWGKKLLEYSKDIIQFYIDRLGFYPQSVISIVPGYSRPHGGWPICPNVVGIHRGIDLKKERAETHAHWIMAHEIGHQYWGFNYVLEPVNYPQWLGIGMGIFTDRFYTLNNIPDFNHSKAFSRSYLRAMKKGYNTTIMQTVDTLNKQGFDWNNALLHDKSFSVLQMLAYELGDTTFLDIYKYCLNNHQGINITLDMFKKDCERISKRNLDDFFSTWFFSNKYLDYQIDTVITNFKNGKYENEVRVGRVGNADISHVIIDVYIEGGEKKRTQISGTEEKVSFKLTTDKPINRVVLDPDLKLLLVNRKEWNK